MICTTKERNREAFGKDFNMKLNCMGGLPPKMQMAKNRDEKKTNIKEEIEKQVYERCSKLLSSAKK